MTSAMRTAFGALCLVVALQCVTADEAWQGPGSMWPIVGGLGVGGETFPQPGVRGCYKAFYLRELYIGGGGAVFIFDWFAVTKGAVMAC